MDIQYALDVQLQHIADEFNPDYAMAIVLDAQNGDILGMSSYPWYDINALGRSDEDERRNHAVNYLYEPGSVFKLFSIASILQIGEAQTDEPFLCDGSYTFNAGSSNITINCTSTHGEVDVRTMLAKSCNGAISHWALQTDPEAFYSLLAQLGFTSSYDISLPSQAKAYITNPSQWSEEPFPPSPLVRNYWSVLCISVLRQQHCLKVGNSSLPISSSPGLPLLLDRKAIKGNVP